MAKNDYDFYMSNVYANSIVKVLPNKSRSYRLPRLDLVLKSLQMEHFILDNVFGENDLTHWNLNNKSIDDVRNILTTQFPSKEEGVDYFLFEYDFWPYGMIGLVYVLNGTEMKRVKRDTPFLQRQASITPGTFWVSEGKYGTKKKIRYTTKSGTWVGDNFDLESVLVFSPV